MFEWFRKKQGPAFITHRFHCERDGLTIRGSVFRPDDAPRPAVVLSHGFLATSRMNLEYAKLLAAEGYVAVIFDFCGGGIGSASEGRSEDMTIFTEVKDLMAVIAYVKTLPYVIQERISLFGCSQGGVVSALAAKEVNPEKLVLLYPAVCIPDDARRGRMMFYRFDPENIPDLLGSFPMRLGGDYARTVINLDIYQEIKGYEGPVLYLQGVKDKIVLVSYARKAHKVFPGCEYHEIEKGGHGFKRAAEEEARKRIGEFMRL